MLRSQERERDELKAVLRMVYTEKVLTLQQRDCVVQYICEVCSDYRLTPLTSYNAMIYFDRYMAARGVRAIERTEAELISLTCVLIAAKFIERRSPGIDDLCAVAAKVHPRTDFTAAEMLTLELLQWQLHVVTPHSLLKDAVLATSLGEHTAEEVLKHAEFFVNLSSFELLGEEYSGPTTAGACVFCAFWNMSEEEHEHPSPRLQQIAHACGPDADIDDVRSCIGRLVRAFTKLANEQNSLRVPTMKQGKEVDTGGVEVAKATADAPPGGAISATDDQGSSRPASVPAIEEEAGSSRALVTIDGDTQGFKPVRPEADDADEMRSTSPDSVIDPSLPGPLAHPITSAPAASTTAAAVPPAKPPHPTTRESLLLAAAGEASTSIGGPAGLGGGFRSSAPDSAFEPSPNETDAELELWAARGSLSRPGSSLGGGASLSRKRSARDRPQSTLPLPPRFCCPTLDGLQDEEHLPSKLLRPASAPPFSGSLHEMWDA